MAAAIRIHNTGGPEVMSWEEVRLGTPGPGLALVRHRYVGVNFIDVYHRKGMYKLPLPTGLGSEAAGVVEAVGPGVFDLHPGDRVAYATGPVGAYAEARMVPAERLVRLPDDIDDQTAASIMLKGLTAQYLLLQTTQLHPGETILLHAAAGGVGQIASQWAKHLGLTVIGTVGNDDKASLARTNGCDHVIVYTREDFVERVRQITGGRGVRVAYDSVGKDTFQGSLDCLQPRGLLVMFGQSSGMVPPFDLTTLGVKGSLYLTRPSLTTYAGNPEALRIMSNALFEVVRAGAVRIAAPTQFPLREAAAAHTALESRRTTGSVVLAV
ncbi:MAG TPA: quinone oxidoreductase [Polyangia bacterium]